MDEDILKDRRVHGDWRWVTREWTSPVYKTRIARNPKQIIEHVLVSERVQHAISQICSEEHRSREDVEKEAKVILEEMAHNYGLSTVRIFGIFLAKLMKKLYQGIYVNRDGIEKIRKLVPETPIILMPTHRSYTDFLLMSYVCFHYNLPLPAVAAGQDFMSMKLMGTMLRNAGAFFIRRSFGKDKLYWAVFTEYVHTHLINGDAPVEFFVEGTRSRSGKSLVPKLGFLNTALEPFLKSQLPDVVIVPISVSYERTLEEVLYAYELLGVPKPKESTKGLLKARTILNDDYGRIFMKIGSPISAWDFFRERIPRGVHNFGPRFLSPLTAEELILTEELAYHVVHVHQNLMVISPFVLISAILVNHANKGFPEVHFSILADEVEWLKSVLEQLTTAISWPNRTLIDNVLMEQFAVHRNIIYLADSGMVKIVQVHDCSNQCGNLKGHKFTDETLASAVSHVLLSIYTNQLLHIILHESMVLLSLKSSQSDQVDTEWLWKQYSFLEKLLKFEFIFEKDATSHNFEKALNNLSRLCDFHVHDGAITWRETDAVIELFTSLFAPVLVGYKVLCSFFYECPSSLMPIKLPDILSNCQARIELLVSHGLTPHWSALSLDLLTNGVHAFTALGAVRKEKRNGETVFFSNSSELGRILQFLEPYVTLQADSVDVSKPILSARPLEAKL